MRIPPYLKIFGYFAIEYQAGRRPEPPEFCTALAIAGGALGGETPEQLDAACEAGANLVKSGDIGFDVLDEAVKAVVRRVTKFGDEWSRGAAWN